MIPPSPSRPALLATTLLSISSSLAASAPSALFNTSLYDKLLQTDATSPHPPTEYPAQTSSGGLYPWTLSSPSDWTAGFLPTSYYLLWDRVNRLCPTPSTNANWLTLAQGWSAAMYAPDSALTSTHDVGFLSWPAQMDFALSGGTNVTDREAILSMAQHLSDRYSAVVGCTKSWENGGEGNFEVIIDNMMNLQLLVLATQLTSNQTYLNQAISHANKTIENHVRSDGSSYHVVDYSPTTGEVMWRGTAQGYSNTSTWARGQAWGIYGFALMHNATGLTSYLDTSRSMAQYFLSNLPSNGVSNWDFQAPLPTSLDTSASTIAASALLLLGSIEAGHANFTGANHWIDSSLTLLNNVVDVAVEGWTGASLVANGTVDNRADPPNNSTGIIYGDWAFVEAGNRILALGLANCSDGTQAAGAGLTALVGRTSSTSNGSTSTTSSSGSSPTSTTKSSGARGLRPPSMFFFW